MVRDGADTTTGRRRRRRATLARGGRRTSGSGDAASGEECACGTGTAGKSGFRLFTGDRVLWIIVAALAVISVLVVYSSTAKMAYDAHTARTTAHFLRQQLLLLVGSLLIMVAVQKINCRIYNLLARPAYFLSVALTVAVYFIGATTNGAARWIPLGPLPVPALRGAEGRHGAVPRPAARRTAVEDRQDTHRADVEVLDVAFVARAAKKSGARVRAPFCCRSSFRQW